MRKNLFIVIEGIDGSGKSTQIERLKENLEKEGHKVKTTFEPTDGPIGKLIRKIFKHEVPADQHTIAGLFLADRLEHILNPEEGLLKWLEDGYTVISDRYYFSSYAYHGVHVDMQWVISCNTKCAEFLRPDVNIYIDVLPEVSMKRLQKGRDALEMYETLDNLTKVRDAYLKAFELAGEKEIIEKVNGDRYPEDIAADIWSLIQSRIQNNY
ncbi:MAG: dTMP kinase [Saprospiraceae bacterium]|nr:dTMP kinase [Saprospiraceae bacterium]